MIIDDYMVLFHRLMSTAAQLHDMASFVRIPGYCVKFMLPLDVCTCMCIYTHVAKHTC